MPPISSSPSAIVALSGNSSSMDGSVPAPPGARALPGVGAESALTRARIAAIVDPRGGGTKPLPWVGVYARVPEGAFRRNARRERSGCEQLRHGHDLVAVRG